MKTASLSGSPASAQTTLGVLEGDLDPPFADPAAVRQQRLEVVGVDLVAEVLHLQAPQPRAGQLVLVVPSAAPVHSQVAQVVRVAEVTSEMEAVDRGVFGQRLQ